LGAVGVAVEGGAVAPDVADASGGGDVSGRVAFDEQDVSE
jgi:hypothetical protein